MEVSARGSQKACPLDDWRAILSALPDPVQDTPPKRRTPVMRYHQRRYGHGIRIGSSAMYRSGRRRCTKRRQLCKNKRFNDFMSRRCA